jgi:hypothetical protein
MVMNTQQHDDAMFVAVSPAEFHSPEGEVIIQVRVPTETQSIWELRARDGDLIDHAPDLTELAYRHKIIL